MIGWADDTGKESTVDLETGYLGWVLDGLCTCATELLEVTLGLFSGFLFNTADMHFFLWSLMQAELVETTSEEEADAEEVGGTNSVIDVEDLGNVMSHMKKAKVPLLQQV